MASGPCFTVPLGCRRRLQDEDSARGIQAIQASAVGYSWTRALQYNQERFLSRSKGNCGGGGGGGGRGDIQILGVLCDGGARHFFSAAGHRIGVRHYHPRKLQEPEEMGERHHRGESCRVSWRKEVHASSPGP